MMNKGLLPQTASELAQMIDHTLLKPDATPGQIDQLCAEARQFGFASVCVNPVHVQRCAEALRGSAVRVCTVIGFPLGANTSAVKAFEAGASRLGASAGVKIMSGMKS